MPQTPLRTLRTALWHLRKGGFSQMAKWQRRRSIAQGTAEAPAEVAAGSLSAEVLAETEAEAGMLPDETTAGETPLPNERNGAEAESGADRT